MPTEDVAELRVGESGGEWTARLTPRQFESEALGLSVFNLDLVRLSADRGQALRLVREALDKSVAAGARLVSCRRPLTDGEGLEVLQYAGFRVVECLLTLTRRLGPDLPSYPAAVRLASAEEASDCAEVARTAFTFDRFHADPAIDDVAAGRLKARWAANSVNGRADAVLVTTDNERITGFCACMRSHEIATIDLIGVEPDSQGRGLGRNLTAAALAHYAGKAETMRVGTQASNYASLALYQSFGFRIERSELTLHAHLS